jgi:hypothetical protein
MSSNTDLAGALDTFDTEFGGLVGTALAVYAERMRDTAAECEAGLEQARNAPPEPCPEPVTHPDGTTVITLKPTAGGYRRMAEMFREAADKADAAQAAYTALTEIL